MNKLDLNKIRQRLTGKIPFEVASRVDATKLLLGNFTSKSPKVIAAGLTIVIIGGSSLYYFHSTSIAYNVVIDNQKVGIVSSPDEGHRIVHDYLVKVGEPLRQTAKIHNNIQYEPVRVNNSTSHELKETDLKQHLNVFFEGAQLIIDNTIIATLGSQTEADEILNSIKTQYAIASTTNKLESVDFEENVIISPVQVALCEVTPSNNVLELLKEGKVSQLEYAIEPNDSWWLIARKNDMRTKDLLAGNPGATEDSVLQIGQKINIVKATPYLTVVSKGIRTVSETVPFEVQTKTDYSLASGQSRIQQTGGDGEKKVTFSYIEKNGKIVEKKIINEEVLKQPVTQVVTRGPSSTVVTVGYSRGSGKVPGVMWPLSGRINSYYGSRRSGFHTGIDIDGDKGDPYAAAADGTVVSARWQGSYGLCILIDHGNGVMTRYAHSTKLLVSEGDKVSKGQTLGLVGSTGRSTGPHLHFEIIVNGDTVNPLSYLT